MTKLPSYFSLIAFGCVVCVVCQLADTQASQHSFSDTQTRLPCVFTSSPGETVVQVTWSRRRDAEVREREQIISAHFTDGLEVSPDFQKRFRFESSNPTLDSTLLILNTQRSDQAVYTCSITMFPSGSFQSQISLSVWTVPISSLEPVVLQEGHPFSVAASCRSVGHPPPRLSWDTDVRGQMQNRSGEDGLVTSQFLLQPLRSLNGRTLDCVIRHPAFTEPRRIRNTLVVHFPPDVDIIPSGSWRVGDAGSELRCLVKGNPPPENITWSRKDAGLPASVSVQKDRLLFSRPLNVSDAGVYVCRTANSVGNARAEFSLEVGRSEVKVSQTLMSQSETLLIIVGASAAGLVLVVVVTTIVCVNCRLRNKNKKLKRALSERTEEMISLSRQVSMRRLNSMPSETRLQHDEGSLLRLDSVIKASAASVEDRSTLSDIRARHADGEYDSLGRPAIYTSYRTERVSQKLREIEEEKHERRRRVESYVRSSNMSLDSGLHRDQASPPPSVSSGPAENGWKRGSRREIHREERDTLPEGEESNSTHLSEAVSNYFQCSDSGLTPRANPNAIILHSRGHVI